MAPRDSTEGQPNEAWTAESGLSPYRVRCSGLRFGTGCGPVHLTSEEYLQQLSQPSRRWRCPRCGEEAAWDDAWYEGYVEAMDDGGDLPPWQSRYISSVLSARAQGLGLVGVELVHLVDGGKLLCRGRLEQYEQMVELSRFRAGGSGAPSVLITCAGCLFQLSGDPKGSLEDGSGALTLVEGGRAPLEGVSEALQTLLGQLPADADLTAYNTVAAFVEAVLLSKVDPNAMCECGDSLGSHMVVHLESGAVFKCTLREDVFTAVGA